MARNEKIGIVGSGFIGRSWAMLFAAVGYDVCLYDVKPEQVAVALSDIEQQLYSLEKAGTLRGKMTPKQQLQCIRGASSLKECVQGAKYIQEAVFEDKELKKKVFREIDELVDEGTLLASSSSIIVPSAISEELKHRHNFLVAHPVNPPYYLRAVELVPAPWTKPEVMAAARAIMEEIGQAPVSFTREIVGFGVNRMQYTLLNECNYLVNAGFVNAADLDTLMKDGLGPRYAWMGPLETALLNADGMKDYLERYGAGMMRLSKTFQPPPEWTPEANATLLQQLDEMVPLDQLLSRRMWRDERLAAVAKLKTEMKAKEQDH